MPSSHLILCHPLLLLPPIPPSIRVFSKESTLRMRWPKYCSFSFSIIPSKEIPGLISFKMDCLDLLAVQGTLKSLLQHHSSKASILWRSAVFTVQLSHPYMITGKTIALTRRTFVDKVMSLLLNMLSRLVITFLPRSKRLLISCVLSCVQFFETPWTIAYQDLLSMKFSRQNYWSELPFPPPGDLLKPAIEPEFLTSPTLQVDSLPLCQSGYPHEKEWGWITVLFHSQKFVFYPIIKDKRLKYKSWNCKMPQKLHTQKLLTLVLTIIFWIWHQKKGQQKQV